MTYAQAAEFIKANDIDSFDDTTFMTTSYSLNFDSFESSSILNSPNLSILPLLAYHKIYNDHYRNEKWQPFEPWTCNIDYLTPSSNMNAKSFISEGPFFYFADVYS